MTPGSVKLPAVQLKVVIEESIDQFDQDAYVSRLAPLIGVSASAIELRVEVASIVVTAIVATPDATAAQQVVSRIAAFASNVTTASTALGVNVARVEAPRVTFVSRPAPTPPPRPVPEPPTPPSPLSPPPERVGASGALSDGASSGGDMSLIIIVAVGLVALFAVLFALARRRRWRAADGAAHADKAAAFLSHGQVGITPLGGGDYSFARAARPWEQAARSAGYQPERPAPQPEPYVDPNGNGALNRAQAAMRV